MEKRKLITISSACWISQLPVKLHSIHVVSAQNSPAAVAVNDGSLQRYAFGAPTNYGSETYAGLDLTFKDGLYINPANVTMVTVDVEEI